MDGRVDEDWSMDGLDGMRSNDGRDALRVRERSIEGREGRGRCSYCDILESCCDDDRASYCDDARPEKLRSCERREKPIASSGDSGKSCIGRGRSGVPRRSGVLRPMAGGGVAVDLGPDLGRGLFEGVS